MFHRVRADFLDIPHSPAVAAPSSMSSSPRYPDLLRQPFVRAVLDPTLIPGIYNGCDQWCMYCPMTGRCLAYRCRPDGASNHEAPEIYANIAARMREGMQMLRDLHATEGRRVPELEALIAEHLKTPPMWVPTDDPLERMGRRYARVASGYIASHPDSSFSLRYRPMGPTPFEVFAWYHVLIAVKICRAITSSAGAARGERSLFRDALVSAKTALLAMDRSRAALAEMQKSDEDVRLPHLVSQLRRLTREVEARFPEARSTVRPGLDVS